MGRCNSSDHIARDHIHRDIRTCNIAEQAYHLGMASNRLLGGGGAAGGEG